jgi:hypothetical protein
MKYTPKYMYNLHIFGLNVLDFYDDNYLYDVGDTYQIGHYTAYCHDVENWYHYDDKTLSKVRTTDNSLNYDTSKRSCYVKQNSEPNKMNQAYKYLKINESNELFNYMSKNVYA